MITDQGRQYISSVFKNLLDKHSIKHVVASAQNPTGNSISERINQTINTVLRINRNSKLSKINDEIETRINYCVNRTTGFAPFKIFNTKVHDACNISERDYNDIKKKIEERILEEQNRRNRKRKEFDFKMGMSVLKRNFSQDKVDPLWLGPYKIVAVDCHKNWVILDQDSNHSR